MTSATSQPLSVPEALGLMQQAVRSGDMVKARGLGSRCVIPLGLSAVELQLGSKISEGAESVVYQGRYNGVDVAVKKVRISTSADLDRFRSELQLLATFNHPHVIPLLGAKALPPDYLLVLPLASRNLKDKLYEAGWRPTWQQLLELSLALSSGMAHIHEAGVLHRDLKPANVLVFPCGSVKITDFGISTSAADMEEDAGHTAGSVSQNGKPTGGFHKRHMVGTLEYMAPEVLLKAPPSRASDVYAFAVMVNELATARYPFSDCTKDNPDVHTVLEMGYGRQELAAAVAAEGLRPTLPAHSPPGWGDLMSDCWQREPGLRPSFATICERLHDLLGKLQQWEQQQEHMQSASSAPDQTAIDMPQPVVLVHDEHEENAGSHTGVDSWLQSDTSDFRPCISAGSFEAIGPRDTMEDRHIVAASISGCQDVHLFAVFDGHRGADVAAYCKSKLPELLSSLLANCSTPQQALRLAFLQLEAGYREIWDRQRHERQQKGQAEERYPGSTAVVALIVGSHVYVANAGDSRAVLCRAHHAVAVSRDHTAALHDERERVIAAGGSVDFKHNSWRIGKSGLQVTRCIGDFDEKGHGVTAEPEIMHVQLTPQDTLLLLATDGLWDSVTSEEAVGIIRDTVKEPTMCAKRLCTEALARGSNDNVTVVVAFLQPVSTLEKVFAEGRETHELTGTLYGSRARLQPKYHASSAIDEVRDTY